MRPAMETAALEPNTSWTERGTWRGIAAELTLRFAPRDGGSTVTAEAEVRGRGLLRPLGPVITTLAGYAVPGDLRRASLLLSERARGQ